MKISYRITKMHKKVNNYYPVDIEFGTCDLCKEELDPLKKAYLQHEHIICLQCYRKKKGD